MKRRNNLIEAIADIDNLRFAVWKAGKGKRYTKEVMAYCDDLDENLLILRRQVLEVKVEVGAYSYFKIYEPKERQICASAFREQVLHHALMNVCHEDFEKKQIYDSYASRKGKGTHAAIKRAKKWTKQYPWYLKLDVRNFFASISHAVLKQQLQGMYKDEYLLRVFDAIIDSYSSERLFGAPESDTAATGLPIGNLTSQYFANHFLCSLDHFIKEIMGVKAYVRYMDDMVLWHMDKCFLLQCKERIEKFIENELECAFKPFQLNKTEKGLPFLGFLIFPDKMRLTQKSKSRFIKKIMSTERQLLHGKITEEEAYFRSVTSVDFINQAEVVAFKKGLFIKKGKHHRALIA